MTFTQIVREIKNAGNIFSFYFTSFVSNCYVHASFMPFCFKSHPYMNEKLEQK